MAKKAVVVLWKVLTFVWGRIFGNRRHFLEAYVQRYLSRGPTPLADKILLIYSKFTSLHSFAGKKFLVLAKHLARVFYLAN